MPHLFSPLTLRSGAVLPNRIAKAAMEEGLAGVEQAPDGRLVELYRRWGAGGTGLLITGNVMVHAEALTGPGAVVLDARSPLQPFRAWAAAAKENGASVWMQISHPGRQIQKDMPGVAWGPSAKSVDLGRALSSRFAVPGGITRRETAEAVVAENVAVVGIGTALAVTPDLPARWRAGTGTVGALRPVTWRNKAVASTAQMGQVRYQLRRMAAGKHPRPGVRPVTALLADLVVVRRALGRYRRWLDGRPSDGAALPAAVGSGE